MANRIKHLLYGFAMHLMHFFYRIVRKIDYRAVSHYILMINQCKDINAIVHETALCLKEIVDYRFFGFVIKTEHSVDVWADPRSCSSSIVELAKTDFECQNIDPIIHYFDDKYLERIDRHDNFDPRDIITFAINNNKITARLYITVGKTMLNYYNEILNIITKSLSIAVETAIDINRLNELVHIDPLTNCYNRRAFNGFLEHYTAQAQRHDTDLSLIIFDIDHFKKINDTYGHQAGDIVLQEISRMVSSSIRKSDMMTRYGGEEFVLLLPNTPLISAVDLAEKIRYRIENHPVLISDKIINLTASFGVSTLGEFSDVCSFINSADKMLYSAKDSGRNTVMPSLSAHIKERIHIAYAPAGY